MRQQSDETKLLERGVFRYEFFQSHSVTIILKFQAEEKNMIKEYRSMKKVICVLGILCFAVIGVGAGYWYANQLDQEEKKKIEQQT